MTTEQHTAAEERQPSKFTKRAMKEQTVGLQPRAYSIPEFCAAYSLSRARAYVEIKAKRLRIRKVGKATRIAVEDAEAWFASLAEAA